MRLLVFDTSAAHCAAALVSDGTERAARFEEMTRGQGERLMPMLEEVLAEAGTDWAGLDALAVCTGPGNFTGIRLSVAAARGLAMGLGVPAVGVSVPELLAADLPGEGLVLLDARQGQIFAQRMAGGRPVGAAWTVADIAAFEGEVAEWVVGHGADAVSRGIGCRVEPAVPLPDLGRLARCAQVTLGATPRPDPPAPVYARPPDAALPAEPPPVILPGAGP